MSRFLFVLLLLALGGCAGLGSGFVNPQVSITSFNLAPGSTGLAPRFAIGLRIVNPNSVALPLRGMSYEVAIEGSRILNGATPDLPTIAAYDEAEIVIEAAPDLLGSARLLGDLFSRQRATLDYTFRARIDAGRLLPALRVEESGNFGLPRN